MLFRILSCFRQVEESCTVGFVADEALVIGFPGDDICVADGSTRKLL